MIFLLQKLSCMKTKQARLLAHPPIVWLVPAIALGVALWLIYPEHIDRGTQITIEFADASGIQVGNTDLAYRGVPAGKVKEVKLKLFIGVGHNSFPEPLGYHENHECAEKASASRTPDIGELKMSAFSSRRLADGVAHAQSRSWEEGLGRVEFLAEFGDRSRAMSRALCGQGDAQFRHG